MKWITREKVKVDRVARPWLIRKLIDPAAEFVFLPHDTDRSTVREGIVYDVPGCGLGHHGEEVSFDAILKKAQFLRMIQPSRCWPRSSAQRILIPATLILPGKASAGSPMGSARSA